MKTIETQKSILIFLLILLLFPLELKTETEIPLVLKSKNLNSKMTSNLDTLNYFFQTYAREADLYLQRFPGTPLNGQMLANSARRSYEKYNVIVPLELALAQAQIETGMGRKGRNPETNPFNVAEYDTKTAKRFARIEDGVQAYYDLIARDYLTGKSLESLFSNFVNVNGRRYASSPTYEKTIHQQYKFIRRWLDNNLFK